MSELRVPNCLSDAILSIITDRFRLSNGFHFLVYNKFIIKKFVAQLIYMMMYS